MKTRRFPRKRIRLCVLLIALFICAGLYGKKHPIDFDQVVICLSADHQGTVISKKFVGLIGKIATSLHYDGELKEFGAFISEAIQAFKIEKLYQSGFAIQTADGYKTLQITGQNRAQDYFVALLKTAFPPPLTRMGDFIFRWHLKQNAKTLIPNSRSFSVRADSRLKMDEINHQVLHSFLSGIIQVLDPVNLQLLPQGPLPHFKALKGDDAKVFYQLHHSFPRSLSFWEHYIEIPPFLTSGIEKKTAYTKCQFQVRVNLVALEKDYPHLSQFVEVLLTQTDVEALVKDDADYTLIRISKGKSQSPAFCFTFYTRAGRLLPFKDDGLTILTARPVNASENAPLFLELKSAIDWAGLTITFGRIRLKVTHAFKNENMSIKGRLIELPRIQIHGWLFYLIPILPIKIDPQNVAPGFTKVMMTGNNGRGAMFSIDSDAHDPRNGKWRFKASIELLDSFSLAFMTRVAANMFPDEREREEMGLFLYTVMSLAEKDIADIEKRRRNAL